MKPLKVHFDSMKRKIVVIGSNSFSGSDFINYLLDDSQNQVIGISRSPEKSGAFLPYKQHGKAHFKFYRYDLNHDTNKIISLLTRIKPEYIVNFAALSEVAPSWDHPDHWFETNVVSLSRLGHYLKDAKFLKRYLHVSSPEVYGTCEGVVRENAPLNPTTPYAASKAAADLYLFTLVKNFQFPVVFVRSTNVYGAHQQLFKIIPRSIINIKLGKKIELHGGGQAVKSYIHIRDVSRGESLILKKGRPGEIYHLSPDKGVAVRDVVALICKIMGVDFKKQVKIIAERLGQDAAYVIDSTKARREFGWKPTVLLESGIKEVIAWVENNWTVIKKLPLTYIHRE